MKVTKMMLILVAVFAIFLFASGQGYSAPIIYTGIDLADNSSTPRPNSDAAAANFDAAAALLGSVNTITFEGLGLPVGSTSFTAASGVNVTYTGVYWNQVPINTGYYSGVNDGSGNGTWGFNTTAGGSYYLGVYPQPLTSGNIVSVTFTLAQPINAFGVYFSGLDWFPQNPNNTLTLNYGSNSLHFENTTIDDPAVRFFGIIDTVPISQITLTENVPGGSPVPNYDFWGLDDVRYASSAAPIPEPATMLLLGLGLAGLAGARRKFKS